MMELKGTCDTCGGKKRQLTEGICKKCIALFEWEESVEKEKDNLLAEAEGLEGQRIN